MGIQIANPVAMPAVVYDRIHMTRLEINQPTETDNAAPPIYQVAISYRHYGVVEGARHYANEEVQVVYLPDYLAAAMTDVANGDMLLLDSLRAVEKAIAAIINDQTTDQAVVI